MHPRDESGVFVYGEALARHYDSDYAILRRDAGDVGFYRELARASAGPALEVGCGTGRVLLPVARAGVPVTGVDPSPAMRAVLARRLASEPAEVRARVELRPGSFTRLCVDGPFALVYAPFRAFQHLLTPAQRRDALVEMTRVLAPDGRLAFDLFDLDPLHAAAAVHERSDYRLEEHGVLRERRSSATWDSSRRILRGRLRWLTEGVVEDEADFVLAAPDRAEIEGLLAPAGLRLEALYADFGGRPWCAGDPRELVFLVRRAG